MPEWIEGLARGLGYGLLATWILAGIIALCTWAFELPDSGQPPGWGEE